MSFDFVPSKEFFDLLYQDQSFCEGLGRAMLAAGRLETNLRAYIARKGLKGVGPKTTLGGMVRVLKESSLLSYNGKMHFDDLTLKRNYLAHSIYDLFSERVEETILPRHELTAGDVDYFRERASGLADDFFHFSKIVESADVNKDILL